jgi:hypothetical protein
MAQKRMFDKKVIGSDKFLDLPNSTKALYFMAGMEADDKGFFQPRKLQRMCGFSDDDYKLLIAKGYFITFESGVMVVTDWNKNNWLDSRRITETEYVDELNMLKLINQKYEFKLENDYAKPMLSEYSIEENSIEENNINNISTKKHKYGEYKHVLLTDNDLESLKNKYTNYEELIKYLDEYIEMKGYKAKNHKLAIEKWVVDAVNEYNKKHNIETKPEWFNQDIKTKTASDEDINEINKLLEEL